MDLNRVIYDGEEYDVVPICPITGYPLERLAGSTEKAKEELADCIEEVIGRALYNRMVEYGALKRNETVEGKIVVIDCEALVLVKRRAGVGAVPEDPERNPPHTHDT